MVKNKNSNYKKPFIFALLLHVILFIFLFVKFAIHHTYAINSEPKVNIVHAVAVNQAQVEKEIEQIKEEKIRHEQQELARIKRLQKEALAAKKARIEEQIRLKKIKEEQVEAAKKAQIAAKKAKIEEENKLKKIKETQAAKAKLQADIQKSIDQQIAAEQMHGEIDKYKALIIAAISQHWIIPENVAPNISCQLLVHVASGGIVTGVDLTRSSGNQLLDRSARTAVLKASPLPVPSNPELFNGFRELKLTAKPEGIS